MLGCRAARSLTASSTRATPRQARGLDRPAAERAAVLDDSDSRNRAHGVRYELARLADTVSRQRAISRRARDLVMYVGDEVAKRLRLPLPFIKVRELWLQDLVDPISLHEPRLTAQYGQSNSCRYLSDAVVDG